MVLTINSPCWKAHKHCQCPNGTDNKQPLLKGRQTLSLSKWYWQYINSPCWKAHKHCQCTPARALYLLHIVKKRRTRWKEPLPRCACVQDSNLTPELGQQQGRRGQEIKVAKQVIVFFWHWVELPKNNTASAGTSCCQYLMSVINKWMHAAVASTFCQWATAKDSPDWRLPTLSLVAFYFLVWC